MDNVNEKLVEARVRDIFVIVRKNHNKKASDFLDPLEQEIAHVVARGFPDMVFHLDGGHETAERKVIVVYPEGPGDGFFETYLGALRIIPKDPTEFPGHRDYLGAILNLGIKREKLGDILVSKTGADIIVKQEIMEYIGLNLVKVRNTSVEIEEISLKELLQPERPYREMKSTVASLRLDAIASIAFGLSRSKMVPFIKGENVRLNFRTVRDTSTSVKAGDMISANRLGRAKIAEIGGKSRKGRIFVKIHKYISR